VLPNAIRWPYSTQQLGNVTLAQADFAGEVADAGMCVIRAAIMAGTWRRHSYQTAISELILTGRFAPARRLLLGNTISFFS